MAAKEKEFRNLQDSVVKVWFGFGQNLPPKRTDSRVADAVVKLLREVRLDRRRLEETAAQITREGFPDRFPEGGAAIFWLPDKSAGFQVVPVNSDQLFGPFAEETRFACELSMSTQVSESQVHAEVRRVVEGHDQAGTDHLLITVGGPDQDGLSYPAEEQLITFLPQDALPTPPVQHLKRVSIHAFRSGLVGKFDIQA